MIVADDVTEILNSRGRESAGLVQFTDAVVRADVPRVAIRAWSMRTVFGDAGATWDALLSGRFISDHTKCDGIVGPARARQLAMAVARLAAGDRLGPGAGLVVGTSKGSIEDWLNGDVSPSGLADIAEGVAAGLEIDGPRLTVSAACASGLGALIRGAMMIQSGEARQVLIVAAEASVHPLFLGSFQRLGVLAKPGDGCRPFDQNRTGFYMSEAAAAVLLEAEPDTPHDGESSAPIYLERFALGGDATHLTGGDPELRTLRHLLARVIDGRPVDLVHAHGTGTVANDAAELAAIESCVAPQRRPPVLYSHKGALGHSLGAAGLVSVCINCQAHATGTVPANAQTRDPIPTTRVNLLSGPARHAIRRSLAIAAGFGGATAVVSLASD